MEGGLRSLEQIGQSGQVEDACGCLADVTHQKSNAARALVATFLTLSVSGLAGAWQRCERAFDCAHHLSGGDLAGGFCEQITSAASLSTVQKAVIFELEQDELEKVLRYALACGDIRDQNGPFAVLFGEHGKRFKRVLGLLGN